MGTRKHYEDDFKEQVVRLVLESRDSIRQIAKDLDVSAGNLRRWVREFRDKGDDKNMLSRDDAAELARLRRDNKKLKAQRDILEKATALFAEDSK